MARKRMISPDFWTSEDIGKLSPLSRLLFIGLFSNADDKGKGKANPIFLRSTIFPYDDFSVEEINKALEEIKTYTHTQLYEVDGSKYYKLTNWEKWQRVDKPQPSLIPEPIQEPFQDESKNDSGVSSDEYNKKLNEFSLNEENRKEQQQQQEENSKNDSGSGCGSFDSCSLENKKEDLFKLWNVKPNDAQLIEVEELVEQYTYESVKEAFLTAAKQSVTKVSYVEGILKKQKADAEAIKIREGNNKIKANEYQKLIEDQNKDPDPDVIDAFKNERIKLKNMGVLKGE